MVDDDFVSGRRGGRIRAYRRHPRRFLAIKTGNTAVTCAFQFKCLVAEFGDVVAFAPRSDGCGFRPCSLNHGCAGRSAPRRRARRPTRRCGAPGSGDATCRTSHAPYIRSTPDGSAGAPHGSPTHGRAGATRGRTAHGHAPYRSTVAEHGDPAWWRAAVLGRPGRTSSRHAGYCSRQGQAGARKICIRWSAPWRRRKCRSARAQPARRGIAQCA